jgi:hypothetical protein
MTQSTQSDNRDFLTGADFPVAQRRVRRDAGAKQGSCRFGVEVVGNVDYEILGDNDAFGVASEGGKVIMAIFIVVGKRHAFFAVLLQIFLTGRAVLARVDHAAHADHSSDLKFGDIGTNLGDFSDDFVTGHEGVQATAPLVAGLMDIGVANATIQDFDDNVVGTRVAAGEVKWSDLVRGGLGGIAEDVK